MVAGGMDYSVYVVGVVSPAIDIEPLIVEDMRRAVATSATLNLTHAAANPVAEMVDIYLTTSVGIEGSDQPSQTLRIKNVRKDCMLRQALTT